MVDDVALKQLADSYRDQGYEIVERPTAGDLPSFAKDFRVELLGRRGPEGVLVAAKKNRTEVGEDGELPRYAAQVREHPGWRFDLAILEAEDPMMRDIQGAKEPSDEDVRQVLDDAGKLVRSGFVPAALTTAWAGFEAAMRKRMQSSGQKSGWSIMPRQMLTELYSDGFLSYEDFPRLEQLYRWRSQIAHGFCPPRLEPDTIAFLTNAARQLLDESQNVKQPA